MGKGTPLSRSMREDIVAFATMGHNVQQTRTLLGGPLRGLRALPSARSIRRVRCTWRLHGVVGAGKKRGIGYKGRGLTASLALTIRAWCRQPDGQKRGTRLRRLQKFLSMHPHVNRVVPVSTLCRWLKRMGLTRKKGTRVALQQDPEKVSAFWTRCQLLRVDPDLTVWFDESGVDTRDWRLLHGYAHKGERFDTVERVGRGERIDCLTSVDSSDEGLFCVEFVHKGTVHYSTFKDHLVNKLLPRMVQRGKRWLIMDNARWHHAHDDAIVDICRLFGVVLIWMAPYHPQANPCENLFGTFKNVVKDWRDVLEDETLGARGRARILLNVFRLSARGGNCRRWVRGCGYYRNLD